MRRGVVVALLLAASVAVAVLLSIAVDGVERVATWDRERMLRTSEPLARPGRR